MSRWFSRIASCTAHAAGHYWTFTAAVAIVLVWALSGPLFGFSAAWQLAINTGTTIVTFLMVFLLQHTTNRDTAAMHLKLDELVRALDKANDALIGIEREDAT